MTTYIKNEQGDWVEGTPTEDGQQYQFVDAAGGRVTTTWRIPAPEKPTYKTANESVKINGNPPISKAPLYAAMLGDDITITADAIDNSGTLQTQLDQAAMNLPPVLFLPFQKFSGGVNGTVLDEVYFTTTLTAGQFSIHGTFPSAGNWIMTQERMNQSINAIGAGFAIESGSLNIMVRMA